jgi:hypothetical protein
VHSYIIKAYLTLYQACEEAPYLKRFANDWATQALAMQLLKNKRAHSYRCGYLEVPERYAYLKETAAKCREGHHSCATSPLDNDESRDESTSDGCKLTAVTTSSKCKAQAATQPSTQQPRKKQKAATAANSKAKGKGKKASMVECDNGAEDDGVEMGED